MHHTRVVPIEVRRHPLNLVCPSLWYKACWCVSIPYTCGTHRSKKHPLGLVSPSWHKACWHVSVPYTVPTEVRSILWDWSYKCSWATMWMLGTKYGPLQEQPVLLMTEQSLQLWLNILNPEISNASMCLSIDTHSIRLMSLSHFRFGVFRDPQLVECKQIF